MSEIPPPDPTPVNPTPPLTSPAPLNYAPGQAAAPYLGPAPDQDSRTMAMLAHLLGIVTCGVGPLVIWLIKKDQSPFVNDQGKEALNWEISVFIVAFGLGVVVAVITHFIPFAGCFTWILQLAVLVANVVFAVMGAMAANKGVAYRYPFSLRLIK